LFQDGSVDKTNMLFGMVILFTTSHSSMSSALRLKPLFIILQQTCCICLISVERTNLVVRAGEMV